MATFGAAAYTGIIIGSVAVASGRSLGCGSRMSDMFVFTHLNNCSLKAGMLFMLITQKYWIGLVLLEKVSV